jgi:hypothetical protein
LKASFKTIFSLFIVLIISTLVLVGVYSVKPTEITQEEGFEITIMATNNNGQVLFSTQLTVNGGNVFEAFSLADERTDEINIYSVDSSFGKYIESFEVNGVRYGDIDTYVIFYTDDPENSTTQWGTLTANGVEYGSMSSGASSVLAKEGMTYIISSDLAG